MTLSVPVFVINMARDSERRAHMTATLDRIGIAAEFVTAVDGKLLTAQERAAHDPARARRIYGLEMKDSEIGCFLSHYRLYERMVRESIDVALILEDDILTDTALPRVVRDLLAAPFQDWLVVRLDCKRSQVVTPTQAKYRGDQVETLPDGAGLYCLKTQVLGVGAYLIRRKGAERMIAYGRRIFMPIDQTMDRYWENGILPYIVRPFPVTQGDDFGSHSGDRSKERRQAQPLSVRLVRKAQRVADSVNKRLFNLRR